MKMRTKTWMSQENPGDPWYCHAGIWLGPKAEHVAVDDVLSATHTVNFGPFKTEAEAQKELTGHIREAMKAFLNDATDGDPKAFLEENWDMDMRFEKNE